ncbi:lysophospholipid acyltransferase family protein [Kineococcus glutinatus]|uniref:Lysophospholipid acyltransferase family protein n=1 Tax=Kineococcus glutinatus TaxID=1070872 RepID=A0ABP9H7X7_9ACTN
MSAVVDVQPPRRWTKGIGTFLARGVWNSAVHGAERVPATGPVIFAANHASILDGPLLFAVAPRDVHFLVKREMFNGVVGWALLRAGQVPLDRSHGDRGALSAVLAVLQAGGAAGVFPEGTRGTGQATSVRSGVAWLALQSRAPVVPVACLGARRPGERDRALPPPRRRLHFCFGEPFTVEKEAGVPGRIALAAAAERVRTRLSEHVADSLRLTGVHVPADLGGDELGLGELAPDDVRGGGR